MDGSTQFTCKKFKAIHDKQVAKYGKCLTIVLGEFDGKEAAFLLQNMFQSEITILTIYILEIIIRSLLSIPFIKK